MCLRKLIPNMLPPYHEIQSSIHLQLLATTEVCEEPQSSELQIGIAPKSICPLFTSPIKREGLDLNLKTEL